MFSYPEPLPRPAPAPTAPPASVVAEIRRLEGRVAELRARYYPSKPQPAYLAMRTFGTPASAQEWGPCRHAGEHLQPCNLAFGHVVRSCFTLDFFGYFYEILSYALAFYSCLLILAMYW